MAVLKIYRHVAIYFREQLNLPDQVGDEISKMRRKIDTHVRSILKEGKERGDFVFDDLALASQVVTGMVSYAFAWYREPSRMTQEAICSQMAGHVLRTVGCSKLPEEILATA
jgi:hypothetical protein